MTDGLEDLLRACTVQVTNGRTTCAGFFLTPSIVATSFRTSGEVRDLRIGWSDSGEPIRYVAALEANWWFSPKDLELPGLTLLSIDGFEGHPCVRIDEGFPKLKDPCLAIGAPPNNQTERFPWSISFGPDALSAKTTQTLRPGIVRPPETAAAPTITGAAVLNLRTRGVCGVYVPENERSATTHRVIPISAMREDLGNWIAANGRFHLQNERWADAARDSVAAAYDLSGEAPDPDLITTREEFSLALAVLQIRSGQTLKDIATSVNMSLSTVRNYFFGRSLPPNVELVLMLVKACRADNPQLRGKWRSAFQRIEAIQTSPAFGYEDEDNLLFRLYIPSERLYSAEAGRLLSLFRDWLETTRGRSVRQSGYSTASGQLFELFVDPSGAESDLREELHSFSNFMTLCTDDPSTAADVLAPSGLGRTISADFVARVGREVRRLQVDLAHEREERILRIQHTIEAELVEAGAELRVVPRAQIRALIESLVPGASAPDSLALVAAPGPVHSSAPVTINLNQQIINAVESNVVQNVHGRMNLGPQAEDLLGLIDRFGGQERAALQSALYELEDASGPRVARSKAKDRLKKFLRQLPGAAKDVGIDFFEKYIERRMGVG